SRGYPELRVVLELDSDGTSYRLTRHFVRRNGMATNEVLLARDGDLLTQSETAKELERILPEQIARFFLFDGELLRQYEELASDPSRGEDLKRAIERILGIPVLTNSQVDVGTISARVTDEVARAAAANRQTEQLGVSLQNAQALVLQYRTNAQALQEQIDQLEHERTELEEAMGRSERNRALLARRDVVRELIAQRTRSLEEARRTLEEGSAKVWLAVLTPRVNELIAQVDRDIGVLQQRQREVDMAAAVQAQRDLAMATGECPTCGQQVSELARSSHHTEAVHGESVSVADELRVLQNRRDRLEPLREPSARASISQLESAVEDHEVAVADLSREMRTLTDQLGDAPESELRDMALRYSNVMTMVSNARDRKEAAERQLEEQELAVRQLRDQLARVGGAARPTLDRKLAILQELDELFGNAVVHYRERLRDSVQAEATRIFRLLRTREEYDRLQINEGYGLTIVHTDGEPIVDRSAGYEHLVAIALLGALQRRAPIRGPVIMDSPFGRLDPEHKARVVATLPEIADQVVLLVYEDEFDRQAAAEALGPRLLAEHELVGVSARHTELRERT
ncbi:MAG: hypothetical protein M3406_13225, partial [Chloroflexota bacterium]|nr:hypothetical protein [Chloroflexota bacterium]